MRRFAVGDAGIRTSMSHGQHLDRPPALLPIGRESVKSWLIRFALNRLPSYRRAGGKVVYVSPDLAHGRVRVKLGWRTYGQRGSVFGGALYATLDPCYVIMLQVRLGAAYAVWDKRAVVDFLRPVRTEVFADIVCSEDELAAIRDEVGRHGRAERVFHVRLMDRENTVYVACEKTVVVKRRAGA